MGFTPLQARSALEKFGGNLEAAINSLLVDIDSPPTTQLSQPKDSPSANSSISATKPNGRHGPWVARVFIPKEMVGRIIGKGGLAINQIRVSSGADVRIVVADGADPGKTLLIKGSQSQVDACKELVYSMLRGEPTESTFFIPEDMVGRIIGRGGGIIKQIRSQSGTDVRLSDRDTNQEGRMLTIRGPHANVLKCESIINAKLSRSQTSDAPSGEATSLTGSEASGASDSAPPYPVRGLLPHPSAPTSHQTFQPDPMPMPSLSSNEFAAESWPPPDRSSDPIPSHTSSAPPELPNSSHPSHDNEIISVLRQLAQNLRNIYHHAEMTRDDVVEGARSQYNIACMKANAHKSAVIETVHANAVRQADLAERYFSATEADSDLAHNSAIMALEHEESAAVGEAERVYTEAVAQAQKERDDSIAAARHRAFLSRDEANRVLKEAREGTAKLRQTTAESSMLSSQAAVDQANSEYMQAEELERAKCSQAVDAASEAFTSTIKDARQQLLERFKSIPLQSISPFLENAADKNLRNLWKVLSGEFAHLESTLEQPQDPDPTEHAWTVNGDSPDTKQLDTVQPVNPVSDPWSLGTSLGSLDSIFSGGDSEEATSQESNWLGVANATPTLSWATQLENVVSRHEGTNGVLPISNDHAGTADKPNNIQDANGWGDFPGTANGLAESLGQIDWINNQDSLTGQLSLESQDQTESWPPEPNQSTRSPGILGAHPRTDQWTSATPSEESTQGGAQDQRTLAEAVRSGASSNRVSQPSTLLTHRRSGSSSNSASGQVFIPRPMVGRIIGKGGMVINQIRQESGADVRIVDNDSDHGGRTLTIHGTPAAVAKCEAILGAKLRGDEAQHTLFIPEDMVGRIIGKGGSNIKRLTSVSGADAHMGDPLDYDPTDEDECPICLETPMVDPEVTFCDHCFCKQCIRTVLETSEECPLCKASVSVYDLKRVKNRSRIAKKTGRGRILTIRGDHSQVSKCRELVEAMLKNDDRSHRDDECITTMFVPDEMVGRIIGRGGTMIKQLRTQSGAEIRISGRDGSDNGRVLTIRGPSRSVATCKALVEAKLAS